MKKKTKKKSKPANEAPSTESFHSAFSGLATLRAELPSSGASDSGSESLKARQHWATKLKKELGCGATIEGQDVVLLGDVGERAKTRLEAGGFRRVVLGN